MKIGLTFGLLLVLSLSSCGKRGSLPLSRPFDLPRKQKTPNLLFFAFPEGTLIRSTRKLPPFELACAARPSHPLAEPGWHLCARAPAGKSFFYPATTAALQLRLPQQRNSAVIVDPVWAQGLDPDPVTWTTWFASPQPGFPVTMPTRWQRSAWQHASVIFLSKLQTPAAATATTAPTHKAPAHNTANPLQ